MRGLFLALAILVYALLSSSTPDSLGYAEIAVAALLILSLGLLQSLYALIDRDHPFYMQYHRLFVVLMLIIPTCTGVMNGHPPSDIIRDVIPVAFLVLPLILYGRTLDWLPFVLTLAGTMLTLRYLSHTTSVFEQIGLSQGDDALLYLANSPLLPFAAIMGLGMLTDPHKNGLSLRLLGLIACGLCLMAMAVMIQRGPLILSLLACTIILIVRFPRAPLRITLITFMIAAILYPFHPMLLQIAEGLWTKTLHVGGNSRIEEIRAVIKESSVFGIGWGGLWQSPAVADIWVRYTHNMISYYWLKAGWLGMGLAAGFMILWLWQAIRLVLRDMVAGLAIIVPLAIHMTLYTGYKSLDFALLLTLLAICIEKNRASSSSTEPSHHKWGLRDG